MKAQFTNIYVKNLDPEVTQDDFTELFQQFGNVTSAVVQFDDEGKSKGFGFVSFENVNVQPMLGFGNLQIDGKLVRLPLVAFLCHCPLLTATSLFRST